MFQKPEPPKKQINTAIDLPDDLHKSTTSINMDIDLPEPPSSSQDSGIQCNLWRLTCRFKECLGPLSDFSFTYSPEISTNNSKNEPVIKLNVGTQVDHEMEAEMLIKEEAQTEETNQQVQFYTGLVDEDDEPKIRTYQKVDIIKWLVKSDHSYN